VCVCVRARACVWCFANVITSARFPVHIVVCVCVVLRNFHTHTHTLPEHRLICPPVLSTIMLWIFFSSSKWGSTCEYRLTPVWRRGRLWGEQQGLGRGGGGGGGKEKGITAV
jgi:hypothetical protein